MNREQKKRRNLQAKETKIVLNNNLTDEQIERGERKK
jgi:hypothetical protein